MLLPPRSVYAVMLGLCLVPRLTAQEPGRLGLEKGPLLTPPNSVSLNQQIANTIAQHLRQSGQLRHYKIDIVYHNGLAEVIGVVASQTQKEEALRIVQGVPGVERVRDKLELARDENIRPAQVDLSPVPLDAPVNRNQDAPQNGTLPEPKPLFHAPPPTPYDLNPPKMPPYAWPTYAPYNNYSRVAYPLAYPYNAWPYIGPCHPFPKVPLGWRSVKLEWEDGYWWFSRTAKKYDWWRLRYW